MLRLGFLIESSLFVSFSLIWLPKFAFLLQLNAYTLKRGPSWLLLCVLIGGMDIGFNLSEDITIDELLFLKYFYYIWSTIVKPFGELFVLLSGRYMFSVFIVSYGLLKYMTLSSVSSWFILICLKSSRALVAFNSELLAVVKPFTGVFRLYYIWLESFSG